MSAATDPVDVRVPGDKSISHRALIFAALADGESRLKGLLDAADTRSTAAALASLGIDLPRTLQGVVKVEGRGTGGLSRPAGTIDCGNSGTTARLLLGALAGCPFQATLTGDVSLRSRPMRRVTEPLRGAGAEFVELEEEDRLPVTVTGQRPLDTISWTSPQASAQVKTALLLAGITGRTRVEAGEPWVSRDHTERMLEAMGARLVRTTGPGPGPGSRPDAALIVMAPPAALEPLELAVPGDVSSAVYFLALGALAERPVRVRNVGLNPTRTGALRVLERMGASVAEAVSESRAGEPVGDVTVSSRGMTGASVGGREVPTLIDEVPLLAVVGARAVGETRFDGVAELRVKETDRLLAIRDGLRAVGVEAEAGEEHLVVRGSTASLRGTVDARGDHRIAMAFGVLGAEPGNEIEVLGRDAVAISYPSFWTELERVRKELER